MLAIREKHYKVQIKLKEINESVQTERTDL